MEFVRGSELEWMRIMQQKQAEYLGERWHLKAATFVWSGASTSCINNLIVCKVNTTDCAKIKVSVQALNRIKGNPKTATLMSLSHVLGHLYYSCT